MKKLYTIALAAAVALSAAAVNPAATFNAENNSTLKPLSFEGVELIQPVKTIAQKDIKRSKKSAAASRAVTMDDVVGAYVWDYVSTLRGVPETLSTEVYINPTTSADTVVINLATVGVSVKGVVDLQKATLSIPNVQKVGTYQGTDIYFYISELRLNSSTGEYGFADGTSEVDAVVGTIENEGIFFYGDEYDAAGNFLAPDVIYLFTVNSQPESQLWFWQSYDNGFFRAGLIGEMELGNSTWTSAGTAVLDDAWMAPALGRDLSWVVPVEKCNELDGVYRLVHPYNIDTCPFDFDRIGEGYIVFDISDPEMVPVYNYIYCGYSRTSYGYRYCATNIEGYYLGLEFPAEELKEILPEEGYEQLSTYADGTVTVKNAGMTIQGVYEEDGNPQKPFRWQDQEGNEVEMEGSIKFDTVPEGGISNVTVDNNAPAVYYNLQGVRVDNPSNGLYIRRQGNTVTKVMAK